MKTIGVKAVLGAALLAFGAFKANAEEEQGDTGVLDRSRPEYDALGVPAGGFTLFPSLSVAIGSDDNLFATEGFEVSDTFGSLHPEMILQSNWSRHQLVFDAYARSTYYDENPDEDQVEWGAGLKGRIDASRSSILSADGRFDNLAEARGSIDAVGLAAEPVLYDMATGSLSFSQRLNRFSFSLGGRLTTFDYDDLASLGGGMIDQDFRDRSVAVTIATAKYEFSAGSNVVLQAEINSRDYDLEPGDAGFVPGLNFDRDSTGYNVKGGLEFGVTNLVNGKIMIGYLEQDYDDVAFTAVEGASFSAELKWSISGLTDLRFEGGRSAEDTTSALAGGRLATAYGAAIDHEFRRNVIATVEASHTNYDFEGSSRDDDIARAGAGVRYLVNRRMSLGLGYEYSDRSSNVVGVDHARHVVQLNYRVQL